MAMIHKMPVAPYGPQSPGINEPVFKGDSSNGPETPAIVSYDLETEVMGFLRGIESQIPLEDKNKLLFESLMNPVSGMPGKMLAHARINRLNEAMEPAMVCFLDVSNFKAVNDQKGYGAGDDVLKRSGQVIKTVARGIRGVIRGRDVLEDENPPRDKDWAYHLSGDEFVTILSGDMSPRVVKSVGKRLVVEMISNDDFLDVVKEVTGEDSGVRSIGLRLGAVKINSHSTSSDDEVQTVTTDAPLSPKDIIELADPKTNAKVAEVFCRYVGDNTWQYVDVMEKKIYEMTKDAVDEYGAPMPGKWVHKEGLIYREEEWINPRNRISDKHPAAKRIRVQIPKNRKR